ncbi:hypothetical protein OJF2_62220 [Aquisphaera giovannonii]|uniref:MarR family protein n=1 Tax=Aquisphaera giovannonii TaxID=406548 RepID=A0A5B9WCG0_9BACT|nr:MarR family winged helix-turn-helix transcriptional regulator [Aquisphaera giovannonii]QEH37631.1 hypothetical protein OJF2_62220 [Aquisphaera giovannonii]
MKAESRRRGAYEQVAGECIAARVRLMNRVVTSPCDEALRPHGLRVSQVNILIAIACGEERRPAGVCRALRLERSTLGRDVELMKGKGWPESEPTDGGRNQVLRLTPAGHELLARARPAWEEAQAEVETIRRLSAKLGLAQGGDRDVEGATR